MPQFVAKLLWRAPRWSLALTFASILLILWQAAHTATYKPVAQFMLDTYTTALHELIKNTIAYAVPGGRSWMISHPPTLATASHEVAYMLIFPVLLWCFGVFERYFSKNDNANRTWGEWTQATLRNAGVLLPAMVCARVIVFVWQMAFAESYIWFAQALTGTYLAGVQAFAEWVAANYMPDFVLGLIKSRPLDVNHASHVISGLIVTPLLLVTFWWWRGDFKQRRVLLPDMGADPTNRTRTLSGGPLT